MSHAPDLFAFRASYPDHPGYKGGDTSRQAARDIAPRQGSLQHIVLTAIRRSSSGLANWELPNVIGDTYGSLQPRTSELCTKRLIYDCGERRRDPVTRKMAKVWRAC